MNIIMKTDVGNGKVMNEMYLLPRGTTMEQYAQGLIDYYNSTIQSPFDMPRKLVSVREANTKDFLDTQRHTDNLEDIRNCWVSTYGHVFKVAPEGHDSFMYNLMNSKQFKGKSFSDMENLGWVRMSTSSLSGMSYLQSLIRLKPKQKIVVEKILLLNKSTFFSDSDMIQCRECIFTLEDGKIRTKQMTEKQWS